MSRVFVREATGLVREVSVLGTLALAICDSSAVTGWFLFEFFGSTIPGGEIGIGFLFATVLIVFAGLVYGLMAAAYPRSGGDYVWVTRILHPAVGFMTSFYLTFAAMTVIGFIAVIIVVPGIQAFLGVYAALYNNSTLLGWVTALNNLNTEVVLAEVMVIIFTLVAVMRVRIFYRIMEAFMILCVIGLLLSIAVMFASNPATFPTALNSFAGVPNLYQTVINNASKQGLVPHWTVAATLGATLLYGLNGLSGWQYPAYIGGEVKRPQKTLPVVILLSVLISGFLYVLLYESSYFAFGYTFLSATGFSGVNPSTTPMLVPLFVSILVKDNPILVFLINLAFLLGGPALMLTLFPYTTRSMFAWSFDRILPAKFAQVSDRFGTPVISTLVSGIGFGTFFLLIFSYTNLTNYTANIIVGSVFCFMIVMLSAIIFPWRKKDVFEASPSITKKKIGGLPLVTIAGVIGFVYLAWVEYGALTNPAIGGTIAYPSLAFMASWLIFPLALYYVAAWYRRREGIDISLAFKEMPPE